MITEILTKLSIEKPYTNASTGQNSWSCTNEAYTVKSPVDGNIIGSIHLSQEEDYNKIISRAKEAFPIWREKTAPERGEIVRQFGNALRTFKEYLGKLVNYEMGKSLQEGYGEV